MYLVRRPESMSIVVRERMVRGVDSALVGESERGLMRVRMCDQAFSLEVREETMTEDPRQRNSYSR